MHSRCSRLLRPAFWLLAALSWACASGEPTNGFATDDNILGYVYGTATEEPGHADVYQWVTGRFGKSDGRYQAVDLATEFEFGLTERSQASLYVTGERYDIGGVTGLDNAHRTALRGVQASFKHRFSDPAEGRFGWALYVEPGYARIDRIGGGPGDELELETKLLVERPFAGGGAVWEGNLTAELEREHAPGSRAAGELALEFAHGVAFRIRPGWWAGVENRWRTESRFAGEDEPSHSAVFLGPSLHYAAAEWWFTLAVLPQVWGAPRRGGSLLQLEENERYEVRLKIGVDL